MADRGAIGAAADEGADGILIREAVEGEYPPKAESVVGGGGDEQRTVGVPVG